MDGLRSLRFRPFDINPTDVEEVRDGAADLRLQELGRPDEMTGSDHDQHGEMLGFTDPYWKINREERNYAALLYYALLSRDNLPRFLDCFAPALPLLTDEHAAYAECAYLHDHWAATHGSNEVSERSGCLPRRRFDPASYPVTRVLSLHMAAAAGSYVNRFSADACARRTGVRGSGGGGTTMRTRSHPPPVSVRVTPAVRSAAPRCKPPSAPGMCPSRSGET